MIRVLRTFEWLTIALIMTIVLTGCSSITYHALQTNHFQAAGWTADLRIDDIDWLAFAGGDSAALREGVTDTTTLRYFRAFVADSSMQYYVLSVRAEKRTPEEAEPHTYRREVDFDSVVLIIGGEEKTLNVADLPQEHWIYSGSNYCGIKPIPIPRETKSAALRVTLRIHTSTSTSDFERVTLVMPVTRKRLTRTPLNSWP